MGMKRGVCTLNVERPQNRIETQFCTSYQQDDEQNLEGGVL